MVDRLQGLVPHARWGALRSADGCRHGEPLSHRGANRGADLGGRTPGAGAGVRGGGPSRGDALRQRLPIRLDGRGRAVEPVGVVAQARHRAALHCAIEPARQWPARAHAPHAEGGDDATCGSDDPPSSRLASMPSGGTTTRSGRTRRSARRRRRAIGSPRRVRCRGGSRTPGTMPTTRCAGSDRRATSSGAANTCSSARRWPTSWSVSPSWREEVISCASAIATWASSITPFVSCALLRRVRGCASLRKRTGE